MTSCSFCWKDVSSTIIEKELIELIVEDFIGVLCAAASGTSQGHREAQEGLDEEAMEEGCDSEVCVMSP